MTERPTTAAAEQHISTFRNIPVTASPSEQAGAENGFTFKMEETSQLLSPGEVASDGRWREMEGAAIQRSD